MARPGNRKFESISLQRPPVLTAKIIATIDVLSEGRFTWGIGVGWCREEVEVIGTEPFPERGTRSNFPSDARGARARQKPSPQPTRRGQPRRVQTTDRRGDRRPPLALLGLDRVAPLSRWGP